MDTSPVSLIGAFFAGLISFLSPCVLPLIPAYVAFVSGKSIDELKEGQGRSHQAIIGSLLFILGFSVVFIALGASATRIGQFFTEQLGIMTKIAGALVVVLGLATLGVFKIPVLNRSAQFQLKERPVNRLGAFVVGAAFAFGWTPCIGPILAAILAYAATQDTLWRGVLLLSVYSLGLGIPFFLTTLFLQRFFRWTAPVKRHFKLVEIASGLLLIAVGVLIYTGSLTRLVGYLEFFNRFAL